MNSKVKITSIIMLFLFVSICLGVSVWDSRVWTSDVAGEISKAVAAKNNILIANRDDTLQTQFDKLASSAYDASMGTLSAANPRYLAVWPGDYQGNAVTGTTAYVYVIELIPGSTTNLIASRVMWPPVNDQDRSVFDTGMTFDLAGFTNDQHLQDICTDGSYIYSFWADALAKHTLAGAFVASNTSTVPYHTAGCCYYDGYLYAAYFDLADISDCGVRKYDPSDLSFVQQYDVTVSNLGIGSMCYYDGYFYVTELLTTPTHDLRIFKYDTSFTLQDTITLIRNWSGLGIETIERVGQYYILGTYNSSYKCLICDDNWNVVWSSSQTADDPSIGICSLGNNTFLRATHTYAESVYSGHIYWMRFNPELLSNEDWSDRFMQVTVTGDAEGTTVFRIPHSFPFIGWSETSPRVTITPTNANMAAANYYVSGYDSGAIELTFTAAPTESEDYTFELRADVRTLRENNAVAATSVHPIPDAATLRTIRDAINANGNYGGEAARTAYYILTANIDLDEGGTDSNWTPIGTLTYPFAGKFYGNGKTIQDVTITTAAAEKGLFGSLNGATITDLGVTLVNINGPTNNVGGLAGKGDGCTITNCYTTGTVTAAGFYVGGLIGKLGTSGTVSGCYSSCAVTAAAGDVGGLIGWAQYQTITDCYATGAVVSSGGNRAGGFCGYPQDSTEISNCYATGNVSLGATYDFAGGFAAVVADDTTLTNCYATGTVTGDACVAGFIGYGSTGDNVIQLCHSIGAVTGNSNTGGFCSLKNAATTITQCYYNSTTTGMSDTGKGTAIAGVDYTTTGNFVGFDFTDVWTMGVSYPELK